jgi:hypothetical protein
VRWGSVGGEIPDATAAPGSYVVRSRMAPPQ